MKFIHYEVMQEVNVGTEEEPKIEAYPQTVSLGPMSDDVFESNYAIAQRESYNGEVTVEDDGQHDPTQEPTQLDRVEAQATYTAMMTDTLLEV